MDRELSEKSSAAILMVSYGCSDRTMREKTLDRIEADIRSACQGYAVFHAWTSGILRRKCSEQEGLWIPGVKEAMEELLQQGIRKVAVLPTHVLEGQEYQGMEEELHAFEGRFSRILTGIPLLSHEDDRRKAAKVLAAELEPGADEVLALMGHGMKNGLGAAYREMDAAFRELGYENIFVGAMEGEPDFQSVLDRIRKRNPGRVLLAPLMIAAGKHAVKDMGGDSPHSWKRRLEEAGFPTVCIVKGMGEYDGIRRIFTGRAGELASFF